jgi:small conductance mechanosensitive channel
MNLDVEKIINIISVYGLQLLGAIAIFVIGRWALRIAITVVKKAMLVSKTDATLVSFVGNILYALGLAFVVIAALGQLGIQTTSLAAILGAIGLSVGLALQGSLGNLASGVMLIALRPFKFGDHIETSGKEGIVEDINIFTTTLKTNEGQKIIIPNGKITSDIIVNHTP